MKATIARKAVAFFTIVGFASFIVIHVYGDYPKVGLLPNSPHYFQMNQMQELKASILRRNLVSLISPSPPPTATSSPRIYRATAYGADPTGKTDSTEALLKAISDAFESPNNGDLMQGITNLGGAQVYLEGGYYMISRPLRLPASGGGNLLIHGGSLKASNSFPGNRYLIELSASSSSTYSYEYITLRDLLLDSNYRGGGISVINSLRTTIDNCYITHFTTNGILVQGGHETYIRNSFLGQHITAGGDPGEKSFSGTAISLIGNDNAVTDVVIFSAAIGIMVAGEANTLTGVHCYNKATGWGGTGIYLRLPGLTQTRIVNCYMDYTGIVAEDPVQLLISNTFFLGDGFILLKSIKGVIRGVNIVDNMFSGSGTGVNIVQLDQSNGPFKTIDGVVIDRNNVNEMKLRATVAREMTEGNGSSWVIDFNNVLLFPNLIKHVHYTLSTPVSGYFPNHALRNVSENRVVVESDRTVQATVFVTVNQSPMSNG
ncbi:polygalacturonase QRT3 isoform X1 [Telopea speciosissima]|uniref:polygalacturonase QRT3 isoform X1 n=1 Tax=Telopea speciosissima TaxID=54955 RepID=UPI001CC6E0D6|nr:polygalacturonase QRT3 isoform X1 [Telopea speciosissima]XP_043688212.1 polygalacturonase QRT3 isoform X1 [Telopea speciosissima]